MTNNHVLAGLGTGPKAQARAEVTFNDGRAAAVDMVAADPQSDIAIVRAQNISGLTPISMASSANLRVGQLVAAWVLPWVCAGPSPLASSAPCTVWYFRLPAPTARRRFTPSKPTPRSIRVIGRRAC